LTGGGARAAYQVGFLRCLARHLPDARFSIISGVSAGAINAAFLASYRGSLPQAVDKLSELWLSLTTDHVFRTDLPALMRNLLGWGARLISGGSTLAPRVRGLVDTCPLERFLRDSFDSQGGDLPGIEENLTERVIDTVALTTLDYSTGETIVWIQGRDVSDWERPNRRSLHTRLTVDHIMASAALPLLFPAVRLGNSWFGDGGIRLLAPLSPALHLGASRILAISTRYRRSREEADEASSGGYPPPAQIAGKLMNSVFLDGLDEDAHRAECFNQLLASVPLEERGGKRHVDVLVLRPSQDLGKLAAKYEMDLPRGFRFLTRGLGAHETKSADFLSLLMFQPEYVGELIAIGEADAEARKDEIRALMAPSPSSTMTPRASASEIG
jgi:NTE family protein